MKEKTEYEEFENLIYNITWLRSRYGFSKKKMTEILGISVRSLNKFKSDLQRVNSNASRLFYYSVSFVLHFARQSI